MLSPKAYEKSKRRWEEELTPIQKKQVTYWFEQQQAQDLEKHGRMRVGGGFYAQSYRFKDKPLPPPRYPIMDQKPPEWGRVPPPHPGWGLRPEDLPQRFINPPRPPGWDEKVERRKRIEAELEAGMSIEEIKGRMRPPEEIGVGRVRPPYWDRPRPIETKPKPRTTMALGEEDGVVRPPPRNDGPRAITLRIGEYDDKLPPRKLPGEPRLPREPRAITMMIGEYDGRLPPGYRPSGDKPHMPRDEPRAITMMIGEYDDRLEGVVRPPRGTKEQRVLKDRIRKIKQAHGQKPISPKPKHPHGKLLTGSRPKTNLERLHALNLAVSKKGGARVSELEQERDVLARRLHRPGVHNITAMSRDRISELKDRIRIARQTRP